MAKRSESGQEPPKPDPCAFKERFASVANHHVTFREGEPTMLLAPVLRCRLETLDPAGLIDSWASSEGMKVTMVAFPKPSAQNLRLRQPIGPVGCLG